MFDYPLRALFPITLVALWFAAAIGTALRKRRTLTGADLQELSLIVGSTLTLLGLVIGFTFSMSVSRYDQRKTYEEAEANAIGTEYVRAGLLPSADAAKVRASLKKYLQLRISLTTVQTAALAQSTPITALVVSGMNDVLNAQGYTQAAWWNRIPMPAWAMLLTIAVASNLLLGYGGPSTKPKFGVILILPLLIAVSLFLIADIDSPRGGLIHVKPQNLLTLAQSMQ